MNYVAIKDGFYKSRVRKGQTFSAPSGLKGSWFKPVEEKVEKPSKAEKVKKDEKQDDLT